MTDRLAYDPARSRPGEWPWHLPTVEEALRLRGFRPERSPATIRVAFIFPYNLHAWCPVCYPGTGTAWVEETEATLSVGAGMGPMCRGCDGPIPEFLARLGLPLTRPAVAVRRRRLTTPLGVRL